MPRYARLRVLSAQIPAATIVSLGEWKVVADPAWHRPDPLQPRRPRASAATSSTCSRHRSVTSSSSSSSLTPMASAKPSRPAPESPVSWIIGFHNNRAAQIDQHRLDDPPESDAATRFDTVTDRNIQRQPARSVGAARRIRPSSATAGHGELRLRRPDLGPLRAIHRPRAAGRDRQKPHRSATVWELPDRIGIGRSPGRGRLPLDPRRVGQLQQQRHLRTGRPPAPIELDDDAGNDAGVRHRAGHPARPHRFRRRRSRRGLVPDRRPGG